MAITGRDHLPCMFDRSNAFECVQCDEALATALAARFDLRIPVSLPLVEQQSGGFERYDACVGPEHDRFLPA